MLKADVLMKELTAAAMKSKGNLLHFWSKQSSIPVLKNTPEAQSSTSSARDDGHSSTTENNDHDRVPSTSQSAQTATQTVRVAEDQPMLLKAIVDNAMYGVSE